MGGGGVSLSPIGRSYSSLVLYIHSNASYPDAGERACCAWLADLRSGKPEIRANQRYGQ